MPIFKLISEELPVYFNFLDQIRYGEVISSPIVSVSVYSGLDLDPPAILLGPASISDTTVRQKIQAGMAGVVYILTCSVTGSSGTLYIQNAYFAILADDGSYTPSSIPLLEGILPDGTLNVFYTHDLQISGGYMPYSPVGLIAGAPPWMGFTVTGDQLACHGLPDVATTYTFSPTILDAAFTPASAPQVIEIIDPTPPPPLYPNILWTQAAGVAQRINLVGTDFQYTPSGNPMSYKLRGHRATGRVVTACGAAIGVLLFQTGDVTLPIVAPTSFPGAVSTVGSVKDYIGLDQDTGHFFIADGQFFGKILVIKPDNTSVTITGGGLDRPQVCQSIGGGAFAVTDFNTGELRIYSPSNNYTVPLFSLPDFFNVQSRMAFDTVLRSLIVYKSDGDDGLWTVNVDTGSAVQISAASDGDWMIFSQSSGKVVVHRIFQGSFLYVHNSVTGAITATIDYSGTQGTSIADTTSIIDIVHLSGSKFGFLKRWRTQPGNVVYICLHIADMDLGTVIYTKAFPTTHADIFSVTADSRNDKFYVGYTGHNDITSILASAPFTEATITTPNFANVVEWL